LATEVATNQQSVEAIQQADAELVLKNRRIRHGHGKGMLADEDLRKLATLYLETQRRLWPRLVAAGLLPKVTEAIINQMVTEFKCIFLQHQVPTFVSDHPDGGWAALAAAYIRYSDKQQNARSLDDQLFIALTRARQDNVFIPW